MTILRKSQRQSQKDYSYIYMVYAGYRFFAVLTGQIYFVLDCEHMEWLVCLLDSTGIGI